ncbi:cuticle protein 7-like isoform X3 [Macrobrachium nipponense]|uniref:cuticle protein 7-like isoform X2 n=1 Tax=Macrobrachium nipponense TaxID=159736 RepID=UPI0030C82B45
MCSKVLLASFCLVALAMGRPDGAPAPEGYGYEAPKHQPSYEKGMPFDYNYVVKDDYQNLDFGHKSNSDGKVVTGDYHVLLPDGRIQTVVYTADYNGYRAEVTYQGEAKYPEAKPYAPAPSYGAPKPTYGAPEPTYKEPAPVYGTPATTYEEPKALYGTPEY